MARVGIDRRTSGIIASVLYLYATEAVGRSRLSRLT